MTYTRRATLVGVAALGTVGVAGCLGGERRGSFGGGNNAEIDTEDSAGDGGSAPDNVNGPPTVDAAYHVPYEFETLVDESFDGGVGKDGIPPIEEPSFRPISEVTYAEGLPVFGVEHGGDARAYPQHILSHHEIVNDEIDGEPVSVTYCPLTGTAQGFRRGDTTFGVSGRLVNSNLIMYDRGTESWWSQILATSIDGPMTGATLDEFRVVWTTAEEWAERYPDSLVMTDDTGFVRRYENDPYGSYAPLGGYYARDRTMFPPLASPDEGHAKSVVIGARTERGAVAFDKQTLLAERVLTGTVGERGASVVAVADAGLSTGYVYRNPDNLTVEPDGEGYRVGSEGDAVAADALPLDSILAFDAMWFAWAGFYPDTTFVGEHTEAGYGG